MPVAPTPLRRAHATAVLAAAAVFAAGTAYAQIEPPALSLAWPNRADVGDTVTLVGTGLNQDATTIAAAFGSGLACPITRRTATAVDISVPPGAADGYVSVTVSGHLPDGTPTSAVSNGVPLLVIWTFFDTSGLAPVGLYHTPANEVSPGAADHLQLELQGYGSDWRGQDILSRVRHDRTSIRLYQDSGGSPHLRGGAQTAVDPLSGNVIAVASWGTSPVQTLVNLSTGAILAQFPNDPNGTTLTPMAVRFDSSGVLYVGVINEQSLVSVFRFAPGDPISFDFSGPASMVPGGVALQGQWCGGGDMAVGGDGVAYLTTCALVGGGQTAEVLRVPGTSGALFDTFQFPDLHYADGTEWHLAANCRGAAFAAGSCWSSECNNTMTLFDLTNGGAIATLAGVGLYRGFGTDGYDDFFVHGVISVEGRWRLGLRRLTVAELPVGFYGSLPAGMSAAPVVSGALLTPVPDRSTIPPEWLRKRRSGTVSRPAPTGLEASIVGRPDPGGAPEHTDSAAGEGLVSSGTRRSVGSLTLPVVPPDQMCQGNGRLLVNIGGTDYSDGDTAYVLLGDEADMTAWWARDRWGLRQKIDVWWEVCDEGSADGIPTAAGEHIDAASMGIATDAGQSAAFMLFREKVLLLFDKGDPAARIHQRFMWPIHTGRGTLKLHADTTPEGGRADTAVRIKVAYDGSKLGADSNAWDVWINKWGNAFGLPPEFLKGLVAQESTFNPVEYRYEPRKWDYGYGERTKVKDQLNDSYFAPYRFAEPATSGVGAFNEGNNLTQTDKDSRAFGRFPLFTYDCGTRTCTRVGTGMGDLTAWSLYLGSNGCWLGKDDPGNCLSPCGQRMRWETGIDIYAWDDIGLDTPPEGHEAAWWFFNHQDYVAQMFNAASYGLTQVGYPMDLLEMGWKRDLASERGWLQVANDTTTNLYLGGAWLASAAGDPRLRALEVDAYHSEDSLLKLVSTVLCRYNKGHLVSSCDYADAVMSSAIFFLPEKGQ